MCASVTVEQLTVLLQSRSDHWPSRPPHEACRPLQRCGDHAAPHTCRPVRSSSLARDRIPQPSLARCSRCTSPLGKPSTHARGIVIVTSASHIHLAVEFCTAVVASAGQHWCPFRPAQRREIEHIYVLKHPAESASADRTSRAIETYFSPLIPPVMHSRLSPMVAHA